MIEMAFKPVDAWPVIRYCAAAEVSWISLLSQNVPCHPLMVPLFFADRATPDDPVQILVERNLEYSFTQAPPRPAAASQSYWLIEI